MTRKPKALDLYCGAGGAAKGLQRAGYYVVGVDINPQPNYCGDEFFQCDVFRFCLMCDARVTAYAYDLIWASPPCQRYTQMLNHGLTNRFKHPDYIAQTRSWLLATGKPYVIENVPHSPLLNPIMLCGEMFGLRVTRHRLFETSFTIQQPAHLRHRGMHIRKQNDGGYYYRVYGHETGKASWGGAMGIDWMRSPELAQAVPPAYSEWIANKIGGRMSEPYEGELSMPGARSRR